MTTIYDNVLDLIGHTPALKIQHLDTGCCELYLKLEMQNPGGSIKDRIARQMIEAAEQSGELKPYGTIIEATSGNTGISLALIGLMKGYRTIIVLPDKMSREKMLHLSALGAEIIITRSDVNKGHPEYYQDLAERLTQQIPGAFYVNQFQNPINADTHANLTGPEIWQQMGGKLDAVVAGMGTSGTLSGISRYLKSVHPAIQCILADPVGSIVADFVNTGQMGAAKPWMVEGIGEDFIPPIASPDLIDRGIYVSDIDAFNTTRELLRKEGILAGTSTGTLLHAALVYCREQTTPKRVLTFACDTGNKYLSKCFSDDWLFHQGFSGRAETGNVSDLIANLNGTRPWHAVNPTDPLSSAYARMMNHQQSILPVLEQHKITGLIHDTDLMKIFAKDKAALTLPVASVMQKDFPILFVDSPIADAITQLENNPVIAVCEGDRFLGLLTPMHLNHYFKRKSI
jgi:cystathionine beta-synthase